MVFLAEVGEYIAVRIFTAEGVTQLPWFNIANNVNKVVLHDVAFTFHSDWWSCRFLLQSPWMLQLQLGGPETHSSQGVVTVEVFLNEFIEQIAF